MATRIGNVVIECPDPEALAEFYAELLDMHPLRRPPDWMVIGRDDEYLHLAFDPVGEDWRAPRWPDPAYPQQVHLDIGCSDADAAEELAQRLGATAVPRPGRRPAYRDPAGHTFCLFGDDRVARAGRTADVNAICFDCISPRALAAFYQEVADMPVRKEDSSGSVLIATADEQGPMLAFQRTHAMPPNWPDSKYPQQMHIDFSVDGPATAQLAERLGAVRLPAMGGSCPVFEDPAGHPFCLCSPGE